LTTETLSIRLDPDPHSVALTRVFVSNVLSLFGASDQDVEDVRIAVSDIASGLVEGGAPIEIEATITDDEAWLAGNSVPGSEGAGPLLLGSRMTLGAGDWTIRVGLA
jgi:hypothetical protein